VEQRLWLDPSIWVRDGRGRSSTFVAATDIVSAAIQSVASEDSDSFSLVQCFRTTEAGTSKSSFRSLKVDQLALDGSWQYFIRSSTLTPVLPSVEPKPGVGWPAIFACNGLILLHHPNPAADSEESPPQSSIGIVHRVANTETGEVLTHAAYDAIYRRLKTRCAAHSRCAQASFPNAGPLRR
jgi:hypothetical protein